MPSFQPAATIAEHRFARICASGKRISIIYPYYDRKDVLLRSLACLARQEAREWRPDELEIIVVDDGSPGDDLAAALPEEVLYLRHRRGSFGASRARNTGARLANGGHLVFLDPDILVPPDYIDNVIRGFRTFGDRVLLTGAVSSYYHAGSPDPRRQFGVWERPDRPTRRFYQLASCNMAMARPLFCETPGFDEDLIYGELEDVFFGWQVGQLPDTAIVFFTGMTAEHVPHPPGPAHGDGARTREILRRKWPAFHHDYIELGQR